MTNIQKIIKYLAIALGLSLAFSIVFSVINIFISIANIGGKENKLEDLKELTTKEVLNLDIEVNSANIVITEGTTFKIETDSKNIKVKEENNSAIIKEKGFSWFNNDSKLIITVPSTHIFETIDIDAGAGNLNFYQLITRKLNLDLGAGAVTIESLTVSSDASIDGGAGKVVIKNGNINNLDLDMGVGELNLTSKITGTSQISAGVGALNINLIGDKEEYRIKSSKGIGTFKIENSDDIEAQQFHQINPIDVLDYPKYELSDIEFNRVINGNFINITNSYDSNIILLTKDNKLVSIANLSDNLIKPKRIFKGE